MNRSGCGIGFLSRREWEGAMAKKVVVKPKGMPAAAGVSDRRPLPSSPPAPNVLRGSPRVDARPASRVAPPSLDLRTGPGVEQRKFPRARMMVRFSAWIGDEDDRRFSASFQSTNLSVSGAFLESTFFLPVGTEFWVSFKLEENDPPVNARAQIVREERPDARTGEGRSGFGIRFVEFFGQTEVTLAKLFLGQKLREFAEEYLQSKRARSLSNEQDRVVDALAAWELLKVTEPGDPWRSQ
jgi:hypothetical protein